MIKRFLISPPFGTWYQPSWATPVLGSFTAEARPGRLGRVLKTVRPIVGGWRNGIGLRNPGIRSVKEFRSDVIYSFAGMSQEDWSVGLGVIWSGALVELNIGCPNELVSMPMPRLLREYTRKFRWLSVKLPAGPEAMDLCDMAVDCGVLNIHACNAIRIDGAAHSGAPVLERALALVAEIRQTYGRGITIIGGGGVYRAEHVRAFREAGADKCSLCTGLLRPWGIPGIIAA